MHLFTFGSTGVAAAVRIINACRMFGSIQVEPNWESLKIFNYFCILYC